MGSRSQLPTKRRLSRSGCSPPVQMGMQDADLFCARQQYPAPHSAQRNRFAHIRAAFSRPSELSNGRSFYTGLPHTAEGGSSSLAYRLAHRTNDAGEDASFPGGGAAFAFIRSAVAKRPLRQASANKV